MNSIKFQISLIRSFQVRYFHQRRLYCQVSKICWSCSATLSNSDEIFCSSCKVIQKIPKIDLFDLFGLQKQHNLDLNDLTTKFRHFQSQIHPDKFSGKTAEEQTLSSEWSSLINKAYKILQSPLARGEYLLRLKDVTLPEDNSIADPELLLEMMEKNEEVEDAQSKDELLDLLFVVREEMSQGSDDFASLFESGNLEHARARLIKMKYLASIENSIKEKLLRL